MGQKPSGFQPAAYGLLYLARADPLLGRAHEDDRTYPAGVVYWTTGRSNSISRALSAAPGVWTSRESQRPLTGNGSSLRGAPAVPRRKEEQ
jgi:hypothetical protein